MNTTEAETVEGDVIRLRNGLPFSLQLADQGGAETLRTAAHQDSAVVLPVETSSSLRDVEMLHNGLPISFQSADHTVVGTFTTTASQDRAVVPPVETSVPIKEVAIKAINLVKTFGDYRAVDHISFEVKKGEIFGFLGPNGAGKTTTIRMLCTLSNPTEGSATVAGFDVAKEGTKVREHIGLVSEKMIMYDRLTARENLRLFGELFKIPKKALLERIDELLHLVHMEEWADHQIGSFSTGMKQRINVIRALLNEPEILFLDEPTLGLDPQSTSEIREFTRRINKDRGTTIILTTHAMTDADMLCDRIGIIDYGKIIALDTPANLKKIIAGSNVSVVELDVPNVTPALVSHIQSLSCAETVTVENATHIKVRASGDDACGSIVDAVRSRDGKIRSVHNVEPTLEDVFLYLTGHEVREQVADKVTTSARASHVPRVQNRVR